MSDTRVLIVQPAFMHYRKMVYEKVAERFEVEVFCTVSTESSDKLKITECQTIEKLHWQKGLMTKVIRTRPDCVWLFSDVRYTSSLLLLVLGRLIGVPIVLHGQGLVKQSKRAFSRKLLLSIWLLFCKKYVAYAEVCRQSMKDLPGFAKKVVTIENRFESGPTVPIDLSQTSKSLLFVGRLRDGSNLGMLIQCLNKLNLNAVDPVVLEIVGNGPLMAQLRNSFDDCEWIKWHGEITDENAIGEVASRCQFGVYPGRAGLSVLTYLKYGLPVICAGRMEYHMGPEPSMLKEGYNAQFFDAESESSLGDTIRKSFDLSPEERLRFRENAYQSYQDLHRKSYGEEMAEVIASVIDGGSSKS